MKYTIESLESKIIEILNSKNRGYADSPVIGKKMEKFTRNYTASLNSPDEVTRKYFEDSADKIASAFVKYCNDLTFKEQNTKAQTESGEIDLTAIARHARIHVDKIMKLADMRDRLYKLQKDMGDLESEINDKVESMGKSEVTEFYKMVNLLGMHTPEATPEATPE